MTGAFGTSRPRKWANRQLLENHPRIRVGGLRGHSEITFVYGGRTQVVQIEQEWTFGRRQRLRPWFRCPDCNQRCRLLVEKDGLFVCRLCSGYDYRCRHRHRSCPSLNRVRRGFARRCSASIAPQKLDIVQVQAHDAPSGHERIKAAIMSMVEREQPVRRAAIRRLDQLGPEKALELLGPLETNGGGDGTEPWDALPDDPKPN